MMMMMMMSGYVRFCSELSAPRGIIIDRATGCVAFGLHSSEVGLTVELMLHLTRSLETASAKVLEVL